MCPYYVDVLRDNAHKLRSLVAQKLEFVHDITTPNVEPERSIRRTCIRLAALENYLVMHYAHVQEKYVEMLR